MLTNVGGGILPALFGGICVAIVIARELIVSSLRMVAASKNVVIAADKLGKIKTVLQDVAIFILIFAFDFTGKIHNLLYWGGIVIFTLSMVMTVISGISYVVKNRKAFLD